MNAPYESRVFRIHTGGDNRFGFTLVGQYPCQLVRIQHGSPAGKAGIRSGDEVIEVNGVNVEDLKHNCVATFITPTTEGVTELRIRRLSNPKTLKSTHRVQKSASEDLHINNNNHDKLSHVVDCIVDGLKRSDLDASTLTEGPDPSVSNGNDIASDEQLKANFSPVKTTLNTSASADISTPVTLNLKRTSKNDGLCETPKSLEVLVGYLGSIKRPMITETSLGLVTHLRVHENYSETVLLEVSLAGIYVRNSNKQIMMMSSLNSLRYFGVCRENQQILALFSSESEQDVSNDMANKHEAITSDCKLNCDCHVFLVEPTLHENHKTLMDKFQLPCDPTAGNDQDFFPTSSYMLLNALQTILHLTFTHVASAENDVDYSNLSSNGTEVEILRELGVITPQELIKSDHLCCSLNRHESRHEEKEDTQVLCLYIRPLYGNGSMKYKEANCVSQEDYSVNISGAKQYLTAQQSTPLHITDIATSTEEDTFMAEKDLLKVHAEEKIVRPGHKTLLHQRSQSLASNVKNVLQAQAAAAAAIAATQTIECNAQHLEIGNGIRQIYHASSACLLANNTVTRHGEGKVARWAVAFDRLLEDVTGLDVFRNFLRMEFSEENLIFWLACEKYKTLEDDKERKTHAEKIYDEHLKPFARLPVNVDSAAIKDVKSNLLVPSSELLSSLQYQVYTLMKFDSYARFLKSELYRQCLVNEMEGKPLPLEHLHVEEQKKDEDESTSTLKRMFSSTKGKSRKSAPKTQSNTETDDNKKKSILPWRGRLKSDQPKKYTTRGSDTSQESSIRSSVSSLSDSVFSSNIANSNETLNDSGDTIKVQAPPTCKVILPNNSLMYLFCKSTRSLKEGLSKLCESKEYSLPALDIYLDGQKLNKEDLQKKLTRFINKEIVLKNNVLFRLELPKDRTVGIKADKDRKIGEVLEPVLRACGLDIKEYDVCLRDVDEPINPHFSVSLFHQKHVVVREKYINNIASAIVNPLLSAKQHLAKTYASQNTPMKTITAIDHKVFEGIMTGKRQSMSGFYFDDCGVFGPIVQIAQAGSKESLVSLDKDKMSRSPALFRKKKRNVPHSVSTFRTYVEEDRKSTEEFFILLHRSQNSRMDDQRGLLNNKNMELPDFLKTPGQVKRANPLLVGVPSPRPARNPLKKSASNPLSYASWISKQQGTRTAVIAEESTKTLSRFTRNWSGSAVGRGKSHVEAVHETQTIDRNFFKGGGRPRAESLPFSHEDDLSHDMASSNGLRTRARYHYESETSLSSNNNNDVVWISKSLNKSRMRPTKTDISGDTGYESTTDDESVVRFIIPRGTTDVGRDGVSRRVAPTHDRSVVLTPSPDRSENVMPFRDTAVGPCFYENMATAKRHVRTLTEQSASHRGTLGNDRQAILDNSFLREELKPSRLYSQLSPNPSSPVRNSSWQESSGTPMKCPLFIPPTNPCTSAGDFGEKKRSRGVRDNIEPRICWEMSELKTEEENVRVTFV